jgi:hypothetical protein
MYDCDKLSIHKNHLIDLSPCKHIDFTLVHAKLANIRFKEKYVSTLHTWIEYLRCAHLIILFSTHDCTATLYSLDIVTSSKAFRSTQTKSNNMKFIRT